MSRTGFATVRNVWLDNLSEVLSVPVLWLLMCTLLRSGLARLTPSLQWAHQATLSPSLVQETGTLHCLRCWWYLKSTALQEEEVLFATFCPVCCWPCDWSSCHCQLRSRSQLRFRCPLRFCSPLRFHSQLRQYSRWQNICRGHLENSESKWLEAERELKSCEARILTRVWLCTRES